MSFHPVFGERECGIWEFLGGSGSSVPGILKARFTDFVVNEISLDGNVVKLQSAEVPKEEAKKDESVRQGQDQRILEVLLIVLCTPSFGAA